jgi:glycosyltransferase involved in cell wall biosynthesis
VKVLLWHGYLLSGSGSNIYTANLARIWRQQGHDVLLICQEHQALAFVDEHGDFAVDNRSFATTKTSVPGSRGRVRLVRPAIGDLLPVYVYDDYEGFTVKRFVDLSEDELELYTRSNVEALVTAIGEHRPDAIITGHEIMGPYIAKEACERTGSSFTAKLHGSALEYAVKVQPRYLYYATEGLGAARVVVGGSNYMIEAAAAVVPGWRERAAVVNPGCDTDLFHPVDRVGGEPAIIGFVGKLIFSKGVHHLLAALGLLRTRSVRTVVVGYGGDESALHALSRALALGDRAAGLEAARSMSSAEVVELLVSDVADDAYFERARRIEVAWPGRLDHDDLAPVLPTFDVLAVPSIVPEAFGMVAAEAAACGVLPVVPRHSGVGEVGAAVEAAVGAPGLLTYDPTDPVVGLAGALDRVLGLPAEERARLGAAAAELACTRWSWAVVAEILLHHAVGR